MIYLSSIRQFLQNKTIAITGVSRDNRKFGSLVYKELKAKGYQIYAINPNMDEYDGKCCYKNISSIPDDAKALLITSPKSQTELIVKEAIQKGIKHIWIQSGAETTEAIKLANDDNINLIHNECILMFAEPSFFHKFHGFINKIFGKYPVNK